MYHLPINYVTVLLLTVTITVCIGTLALKHLTYSVVRGVFCLEA